MLRAINSLDFEEITEDEVFPALEPLPNDITKNDFPSHAFSLLPQSFSEAVQECAIGTQTSIEMCFMCAMPVLNLAVMAHGDVRTSSYSSSPISLYFMNISDSGERKSAVDSIFSKPLSDYQSKIIAEYAQNMRKYKEQNMSWMKASKDFEKIISKNDDEGMKQAEEKIKHLIRSEPVKPQNTMLCLSDFNIPSLKNKINLNAIPILSIKTNEGASLFLSDFFKKNGSEFMTIFNSCFDNEDICMSRVGQGDTYIKNKRMNFFLQVQPDIWLQTLKNNALMKGIGFTARLLICKPPERKGTRFKVLLEPTPEMTKTRAFQLKISQLLEKKINRKSLVVNGEKVEMNEIEPTVYGFEESAYELWVNFYNSIEKEILLSGKYRAIHEFCSKIPNICARLAANFHIYECPEVELIGTRFTECAILICEWFLEEHFRSMQIKSLNTDSAVMVLLRDLKRLTNGNKFVIDTQLMKRLTKNRSIDLRIKKNREPLFQILLEHNYILPTDDNMFIINPISKEKYN